MARFRIALPHRFRVRLSLVILGGVTGIAILTGPLIREVLQDGPDAQPAGVGGGPVPAPGYPTRLAEGYWLPPALDPANFSKKLELDKAEAGKPLLTGTINGFRFFGPGDPLPKYPCDPAEFEQVSPKEVAMPIQVGYVPPGTVEEAPRIQVCPGGKMQLAVRLFQVAGTGFSVSFHASELAIYNDSIRAGRNVHGASVGGSQAVVVEPLAAEGHGESVIAWPVMGGFIRVYAVDMPLDEVIKIAESVRFEPPSGPAEQGEKAGG